MNGKVTFLKVSVLRMDYPIYSGYRDNSLFLPFLKKLFLPVLHLRCCEQAFSSCCAGASLIVAHGLNCPTICGISPDQGSNLCPLHWQADS